MIYYFTGTGNSLWTAKELGRKLEQSVESILIYRKEEKVSCRDSVIGFVFPTYKSDIPWIVKEFLLKLEVPADSYLFAVMTSNKGGSGTAFKSIDQALVLHEARLSAGFDLQMPGNCKISSEEENVERLEKAPARLQEIIADVNKKEINFNSDGSKPKQNYVQGSYFYGEHSLKRLTLMKNFQITNACDGCGICASVCPTNNISIQNGKAVHSKNCAACYACLHWCPKQATLLNVPIFKNRKQYHHPEVNLRELIDAKK